MPRSPKVSPAQRKGRVVSDVNLNPSQRSKLDQLSTEHNGISEFRQYDNGSVGVFFNDGKFRFVSGSTTSSTKSKRFKGNIPRLSPRAAKLALENITEKNLQKSQIKKGRYN